MPVNSPEARQHIHELVEQLAPGQIAAVMQLLEVMVEPDEEPLSDDDRKAVKASREHFREHPEAGVSFEQFAAECGFTMDQVLGNKD
jgi:hypothetical protein